MNCKNLRQNIRWEILAQTFQQIQKVTIHTQWLFKNEIAQPTV